MSRRKAIRKTALIIVCIIAGLGSGVVSALYFTGMIAGRVQLGEIVSIGGWTSNWAIGTDALDPYTRAWVARFGLLALRREEAVYFTTRTDRDGQRLDEACDYRISGGAMPGSWWSVTLYDESAFLPINQDEHLSVDATAVPQPDAWSAIISASRPEAGEQWISNKAAGKFDLTLRIYRPEAAFIADPQSTLQTPVVERLRCAK